jgi:hypothetical protein
MTKKLAEWLVAFQKLASSHGTPDRTEVSLFRRKPLSFEVFKVLRLVTHSVVLCKCSYAVSSTAQHLHSVTEKSGGGGICDDFSDALRLLVRKT